MARRGRRRIDLGPKPPTYPIYAIGDVHGCIDELRHAEKRIAADIRTSGRAGLIILLGDYVDRGPASRQVLDHLVQPSELGLKRVPLCGNHDDVFSKFLGRPDIYWEWLGMGGEKTLASYGIDSRHPDLEGSLAETVPASHRRFLADLPVCLRIGQLLFVHAGIRPGIPLEDQEDEYLLWTREPFLTRGPELPLLVVHGHTPGREPQRGPGRIGIDTGAYYSGRLAVLKIDGKGIDIL